MHVDDALLSSFAESARTFSIDSLAQLAEVEESQVRRWIDANSVLVRRRDGIDGVYDYVPPVANQWAPTDRRSLYVFRILHGLFAQHVNDIVGASKRLHDGAASQDFDLPSTLLIASDVLSRLTRHARSAEATRLLASSAELVQIISRLAGGGGDIEVDVIGGIAKTLTELNNALVVAAPLSAAASSSQAMWLGNDVLAMNESSTRNASAGLQTRFSFLVEPMPAVLDFGTPPVSWTFLEA